MHVGLNLVYLVEGQTGGTETYARELVPAMLEADHELRLTLFLNRETSRSSGVWAEYGRCVEVPVDAANRAAWAWGEQRHLPGLAAREGCELLHSLANTAPLRGSTPRVVTIHDLIHRRYPDAHGRAAAAFLRLAVPRVARSSIRIIVVSKATRADVTELLGIDADRVDVVPSGPGLSVPAVPLDPEGVRATVGVGDRTVVLCVATERRHKNVPALIDALALIPPERRPALVLAGATRPRWQEIVDHAARAGLAGDLVVRSEMPAAELDALYRLAALVVVPSLYEGFGLPVLEAMSRGVPVACSDLSSLTEIAGDAALLFDPDGPRSIAQAVESILGDPGLADRLRAAGRKRAAQFTWRAAARGTLESYERAVTRSRTTG